MYVLGVSALYHDSAAALVCDGSIVAAAQEERFTRVKLDKSLPVNAIDYCLRAGGNLTGGQLDAVVFYDDPLLSLHRYVSNITAVDDDASELVNLSSRALFGKKLWIEELLRSHLGKLGKEDCLFAVQHHYSHAASAFYPSPFESAAILTIDGVGEWNTTAIGVGSGNDIRLLKKIDYPHSLGLFYGAFTSFCGFRVNYGDYKLMGLAPYGNPTYVDLIREKLIDIKNDGSFRLNLEYFDFQHGRAMTNERFASLFGGPKREPESQITKREMDIAASAQAVVEEVVLKLARTARNLTRESRLVMAGGVALNCVANGKLARRGLFDDIWVQPAAGDSGGALGAALAYYHVERGQPRVVKRSDAQQGSFLGPEYSDDDIEAFLKEEGIPYQLMQPHELEETVADLLADQKIVGLFSGRMEFGPRALGHRSIITDPRSETMQARLNLSIKYRESFRPFAPAVLAERCSDYFEDGLHSPYMLFCSYVKNREGEGDMFKDRLSDDPDLIPIVNSRRSDIPAVTHVDYSARVQKVEKETNPFFYGIIKAFEKRTGCGVVVNTSFNVRGEPIVCSPEDAYRCFMSTEMDALVLQGFVLLKDEQPLEKRGAISYELD